MVARPEHRGTGTGFGYMFVKPPSLLANFLFPVLFAAIFPLIGLLAAIFILPEGLWLRRGREPPDRGTAARS